MPKILYCDVCNETGEGVWEDDDGYIFCEFHWIKCDLERAEREKEELLLRQEAWINGPLKKINEKIDEYKKQLEVFKNK